MRRSLVLLLALVFFLFLIGLVCLQGPLVALCLPPLAYVTAAWLERPRPLALSARRTLSAARLDEGALLEVTIRVENGGAAAAELELEDELPEGAALAAGSARRTAFLPPGGAAEWSYAVRTARGLFAFAPLLCRSRGTLGFFARETRLEAGGRFIVFPRVERIEPVALRPSRTRGFFGPIASRLEGAGTDFLAVREYRPGDPQRRVNWRLAARTEGGLFTNETERGRVAEIGLILDAREQLDAPGREGEAPLFEHSVRAAAALASAFLREGHRVGLLVYGGAIDNVFPGTGRVQRERILLALARARTGRNFALDSLSHLPTRFFPVRSQIVLVSPLAAEDRDALLRLRARGYRVLVVSPDPLAFELARDGEPAAPPSAGGAAGGEARSIRGMAARLARVERDLLIRRVERFGVEVAEWRTGEPLARALGRARIGRPAPPRFAGLGVG
jgi:uncharacterized protein (DUF58 family)